MNAKPLATFTLLAAAGTFLLAGCGPKSATNDTAPPASAKSSSAPARSSMDDIAARAQANAAAQAKAPLVLPDYKRPGEQLAQFSTFLLLSFNKFQSAFNESKDGAATMSGLAFVAPLMTVPQYDGLERNNSENKKGQLKIDFSPFKWDATRTKVGDEIRCAASFTYNGEASSQRKPGDSGVSTCVLNMKTNTLVIETKKMRDGKLLQREVYEAVILPDKTAVTQLYSVNGDRMFQRNGKPKTEAHYFRLNGADGTLTHTSGALKTPALDFSHSPLTAKTAANFEAVFSAQIENAKTHTIKDGKLEVAK